jgi:isocitrate lyase
VVRLRGSLQIEHTLAKRGADKLWNLVHNEPFVNALGALTGNQAMQQVKAGLKAIYLSGWQVAGDANLAGEMYPDQSLYPANSVPMVVKRINNTFARADQIQWSERRRHRLLRAHRGRCGSRFRWRECFELMKSMIEAGAAGVHFEDQLASVKKCGHMGGKVLVPTREACEKLNAARLAADVMGTKTLVIARTDAEAADLLTSDVDANDKPSCPASAPSKASSRPTRASTRRSRVAWPMPSMPTWSGAKPASPTWPSPRPSPKPSTPSSRASCWPTTARRPSTGRRTWTTPPSPSSSANWAPWATSSSSSRWPVSMR